MQYIEAFKSFLYSQKKPASRLTIKNYAADIGKFVHWYEEYFQKPFEPGAVTSQAVETFKQELSKQSARSMDRYLSSLRKFFHFLKITSTIAQSPFEIGNLPASPRLASTLARGEKLEILKNLWHIKDFKSHLYVYNASSLTIKNYIIDVKQFLLWLTTVSKDTHSWQRTEKNIFYLVNQLSVEEYKNRLLGHMNLSPVSVNRKLSSIRRFITWAGQEGYLKDAELDVASVSTASNMKAEQRSPEISLHQVAAELVSQQNQTPNQLVSNVSNLGTEEATKQQKTYSSFPPLRMLEKIMRASSHISELLLILPLTKAAEQFEYISWLTNGKKIFTKNLASLGLGGASRLAQEVSRSARSSLNAASNTRFHKFITANVKKEFYAPYAISLAQLPLHKKLLHHARYTRPNWYKKYHTYTIVHYFHLAILLIFMTAFGFAGYRALFEQPGDNKVLAAAATPLRILSYQQRLTDAFDNPITAGSELRFIIYNDLSASGAARLWEEVRSVNPDSDGIFSVLLGYNPATNSNAALCNGGSSPASPATGTCGIPQSIFADNDEVFLGVTVENDTELAPRQQIATVAYATNAEILQGLPPTTDTAFAVGSSNANAVLALGSGGTVAIPGTSTTTIQATSGQFKLTGQPLRLETNVGSAGNIVLSPDGFGKIDFQKPIQNNSNSNNILSATGAVEVDDLFAILATSSGQSALTINQNDTGPLISASTSGVAKFTVSNAGLGTFADDVSINGGDLLTTQASFNLLNASATTINFAGAATTLNIADAAITGVIDIGGVGADGATTVNIATEGTSADTIKIGNSHASTTLALTGGDDWNLAATGILTLSASADQTTAIDITDSSYTNSLSIADNNIVGTTANIDFDNFDVVGSSGNITTAGTLTLSALTTDANGVLYANTSGVISRVTETETASLCLISGSGASGVPSWASCPGGGSSNWSVLNGAIFPKLASTLDFLLGSTATSSAEFAVTGINDGTPTATISATTTGNGLSLTGSTATLQSLRNNTLTIGGATTGNIALSPLNGGTGSLLTINALTTTLSGNLDALGTGLHNLDGTLEITIEGNTAGVDALCGSAALNGDAGADVANETILDCSGAPTSDYAEMYATAQGVEYGDIVTIGPRSVRIKAVDDKGYVLEDGSTIEDRELIKATVPYDTKAIGIVSNNYGDFTSTGHRRIDPSDHPMPVALSGRVPVKISSSSESIQAGDYITTSSDAGKGMKATQKGSVIGKALEDWDPGSGKDRIMVFVNNFWQDPDVHITDAGLLHIARPQTSASASRFAVIDSENQTINRIGAFSEVIVGSLRSGLIEARKITSETLDITTDQVTIAGQTLEEYIASIVTNILNTSYQIQNTAFTSPLASIDILKTNLISPLSSDSVVLDGKLVIRHPELDSGSDSEQSQNDTVLDVYGNASFSGTLRAKKLIADDIDLSEEALAKLTDRNASQSAQYITNITNIYQSSSSGELAEAPSITDQGPLSGEFIDIASVSANLAYVPSLNADFATFNQGLVALGASSFTDISVTNQFAIGTSLILSENSINVLGADLQVQPFRQGNISFFGGLIKMDIDGNFDVLGNGNFTKNLSVGGTLSARFISPIPDENLIIQLGNATLANVLNGPNFEIRNASGSGVFKVNQLGDVIASGSARFAGDLESRRGKFKDVLANSVKITRTAQADTSLTETVATASAGTATIVAGQTQRTIVSPFVTKDSLIYLTPVGDTLGLVPYLARQTAEINPGEDQDLPQGPLRREAR
ncbi:MAG TPA: site-specific integrase, partial [Patescibacteria group bacterium]|nr:site-specific integrase [Patescibacteria group bacterium]